MDLVNKYWGIQFYGQRKLQVHVVPTKLAGVLDESTILISAITNNWQPAEMLVQMKQFKTYLVKKLVCFVQ